MVLPAFLYQRNMSGPCQDIFLPCFFPLGAYLPQWMGLRREEVWQGVLPSPCAAQGFQAAWAGRGTAGCRAWHTSFLHRPGPPSSTGREEALHLAVLGERKLPGMEQCLIPAHATHHLTCLAGDRGDNEGCLWCLSKVCILGSCLGCLYGWTGPRQPIE